MSHARLHIAPSSELADLPEGLRTQSADVEHFLNDAFSIADARRLHERAHRKAVEGHERSFLIAFASITREAQNALLKLFEEPPAGVVFHIVVPQEDILLPTLRSRMQREEHMVSTLKGEAFEDFQRSSYKERMEAIAARAKQKDASWFEAIAAGAEAHLRAAPTDASETYRKSVMQLREHMGARGASLKMLCEDLALSLPVRS